MMRKNLLQQLKALVWIGVIALLAGACQSEDADPQTSNEHSQLSATENSQIVAVTEDVLDITDDIFVSNGFTGGRTAGGNHGNDDEDKDHPGHDSKGCKPSVSGSFDLDHSHPDSLIYTGTFSIDYGDGSTCTDSTRIRKGKVIDNVTFIVTYKDSVTFSSTETITFEGFYKDSLQVDGTFVISSGSYTETTVEAKDARITYADGTFFSWEGTLTFDYEKEGSRHRKGKMMKITEGSLSGNTRAGADFVATIVKEILYKRDCFGKKTFVPVSGTVEVTTEGVTSSLDYGDGSCDKDYTVSAAGILTEHTL